jgi:hypothetical protein
MDVRAITIAALALTLGSCSALHPLPPRVPLPPTVAATLPDVPNKPGATQPEPPIVPPECTKDTDCKGDSVCNAQKQCADPKNASNTVMAWLKVAEEAEKAVQDARNSAKRPASSNDQPAESQESRVEENFKRERRREETVRRAREQLAQLKAGAFAAAAAGSHKLADNDAAAPAPTESQESRVDKYLKSLPTGSAVFTAPTEANQYENFDVTLKLKKRDVDAMLADASKEFPGNIARGVSNIRMSDRMRAELIGGDFFPQGDKTLQEQPTSVIEGTTWKWQVHSDRPGKHQLTARIETLMQIDGKDTWKTIDVAEVSINIKINGLGWAMDNWKWLATAIVLPLIGWFAKRKFGEGSGDEKPKSPKPKQPPKRKRAA